MLTNIVLEVPKDLDILAQDAEGNYVIGNDVIAEMHELDSEWPPEIMPGGKVVGTMKTILASLNIPGDDPLALLELLIINYDLDWTILAMQTFRATVPAVYDETDPENPILIEPARAHVFKPVDLSVLDYLEDRHIWDASVEPPVSIGFQDPQVNWLPLWQGATPWVN